ncbi:hypothetical protein [Clostridium baratii]|uniref:hypothetical protein n=1 Tax=Clostridium baratii TaxID=1561 RepID=UPI0006BAD23F|nr:hypothetical protein [Clostridium baratii]
MNKEDWKKRIAARSDITGNLVHLTKSNIIDGKEVNAIDILIKILKEKKLMGSTTETGYIVGDRKAVCFQESPLQSLAQNIYYEKVLFEDNKVSKERYTAIGILFKKDFIYRRGGRPVIYDKTSEAKKYLDKDQWWRVVNFDLSDDNNIIDWTHEREWRVPDELEFELEDISIIVGNLSGQTLVNFRNRCNNEGIDLDKVNSIIPLREIFI